MLASHAYQEIAMQIKTLEDLKPGEGGRIAQIDGGHGMVGRLAALGIGFLRKDVAVGMLAQACAGITK